MLTHTEVVISEGLVKEFGHTFRSARESRGLSIEQVSQETRISVRFLRAIEDEAFEELPGGVFDRGFIRAYAGQVDLDPDVMVAAYTSLTGDRDLTESARAHSPLASEGAGDRHVLPIAVGGLVVLAFLFALTSRNGPAPDPISPELTATSVPAPQPPEPRVVTTAPDPAQSETGTEIAAGDDVPASEETPDGDEIPGPEPVQTPESGSDDESPDAPPTSATTVDTQPAPSDLDAEASNDEDSQALEQEASFDVRVEVTEATQLYVSLDGDVMYSDVIINPPFWRNYRVSEALELRIADPSRVSLNIDGAPVMLGPPGRAWSGTITRDNAALLTGGESAPANQ